MIKVYRKTATIKAEQFDGSEEMIDKYHVRCDTEYMFSDDQLEYSMGPYQIETLEGFLNIGVGDWIATGVNGEHWPIADDVFKQTYVELPVIPKAVADWIEKCKHDGTSVGDMLCYERQPEKVRDWIELTPGTYDFNQRRYAEHQDLIARAWLDGYTVEEDK
ncbi:DUF1642 domain-containing protein [Lactiplantibacillus plantarum]|uniref:DUF1642 domain-containing protein n=1 Tax=Lactiplantibacillus plantarum TaxID=1590 RepID=UPI0028780AA7|nr:DUF1642 domain-containing protein [Lactiplantibacillus plantarum]WND29912.1 DUF1642 domain-containing protein [Lactiplantibacillus plantarum]